MTHKLTRLLALMLAVIMSFSMLLIPAEASSYRDVNDGSWYAEAVEYVTERGWMAGVSETSFAPNAQVTRGMMVTVLARLIGAETDNTNAAFTDTEEGKWYTGAAAWAEQKGVVAGVGSGRFMPNRAITRQDLCVMLYKYIKVMGIQLEDTLDRTFTDMDSVADYAREAVIYCAGTGLISGYTDSSFGPKNTATRAQLAQILMRMDLLVKEQEPKLTPAQSFNAEAGEDMSVAVNAPEGALPEDSEMTVRRITDEAELANLAEKFDSNILAAADISFLKDNAEYEPDKAVEVQISLDGLENVKYPVIGHLKQDGTVEMVSSELVSTTRGGSKALRFYAKDFSVYIIGEGSSSVALLTVEFYEVGKEDPISVQAIRINQLDNYITQNKDYVYDPGVPDITETQSFEGWADKEAFTEEDTGYNVAQINEYIKNNRATYMSNNQDVTLKYYAKVYEVRYVVYHDQAGAVLMTQAYHVQINNGVVGTENVKIEHNYVGFKGEQNFAGWIEEDFIEVAGDYPLYKSTLNTAFIEDSGNVYKDGTTYPINKTLELYPYLNTGHWLVFDNYINQDADATTASYTSPVFYADGVNTAAPAKPTRTGYEFKGWFKPTYDSEGKVNGFGSQFIFGSPINEDTTVVAKWEPKNTTYHVVFWAQKATDAVDAGTEGKPAKTYDYFDSRMGTAITGDTVSIETATSGTTADNRLGYNENGEDGRLGFYFVYNEDATETGEVTVAGDGSTVLNVYYDRKVITFNFYTNTNYNTEAASPISGLYGSTLDSAIWPDAGTNYEWKNDEGSNTYGYPLALTEFVPVQSADADPTVTMNFYRASETRVSEIHIYYVGQELNGTEYNVPLTDGTSASVSSSSQGNIGHNWYPNETIEGFTVAAYRFGTTGAWETATAASEIPLFTTSGSGYYQTYTGKAGPLYVGFTRNTYRLELYSNNEQFEPETLPTGVSSLDAVPYKMPLSEFANYVPDNGPEGTYFDGWYADPALDTPFDFSGTMPANNVRIYAKWTTERFRVILDPTGGEAGVEPSDITFPGNQATTFRVDYGELVQASSINNAQREGYTLLGWYLDAKHTIPFNFNNPVTDKIADMSYANAGANERQGVDPWTLEDGQPKPWDDTDRPNVRGKVTIYAAWRQDPDGVIGINVRYLATDVNGKTGTFSDGSDVWDDARIYADQAKAFAQPASTPDDGTLQFLYWELLDKNGNAVKDENDQPLHIYPGQLWTVDFKYAVEEELTAQPVYYTYGDPEPEYIETVVDPEVTREPTRATNTYQRVTTLTAGKKYLITYTNGSTAYIMGNTLNSNNYINAVSASVSSNTISGDYDQYLFGVEQDSSGNYHFGNLNKIGYLGLNNTYGRALTLSASSSTYAWTLTSRNYLQNTATTTSAGYPIIQYNSNVFRGNDSSNNAAQVITFYELQEDEVTGEEFDVATGFEVGGSYIIAIGDYAVGNEALNSSSNDHFIKGVRGSAKTSSFVLATEDVSKSTWEVVSGDATNGYLLRNKGNGTYLGMSSDGQCYLAATSENLAAHWTYDNGTDLNNHVEEANNAYNSTYYYYLSFSGSFIDFTTSTGTGQGVKIYSVTKSYTVTFVDGYTNEVIDTQTVEEGQGATAPAAPDHTDQQMIFNGWDTDFSNITGDTVVTAQYVSQSSLSYTVTFRYMDSNGDWVTTSQTVQHGSAATAPTIPTPPAGFEFNSWDKHFTNVTSNLTVNAVYKQTATTKYVVSLRARYGLKTTEAATHVYWYANNGTEEHNGAGVRQEDLHVPINEALAIPTPTTFHYEVTRQTVNGLEYGGHTFLGWARLENETGTDECAHPELTEADLWLIWHEEDGGYYTVNPDKDDEFDTEERVTNVAADEMHPYHDLYAVWLYSSYYVFHSSDGRLEQREIKYSSDTTKSYAERIEEDNIFALVPSNYLYGGYYKTYGGIDMTALQTEIDNYEKKAGNTNWSNGVLPTAAVNALNFTAYTGNSAKAGSNKFWTKANAYGYGNQSDAPSADHLIPEPGAVYYLKEVPDSYLTTKYVYTYEKNHGNVIQDFFMLTLVDDSYYKTIGFRTVANATTNEAAAAGDLTAYQTIARTIQIYEQGVTTPLKIDASSFSKTAGYVALLQDNTNISANSVFAVMPGWTTLDGIEVNSHGALKLTVNEDKTKITYELLGSVLSSNNLYISVDNVKSWWYVYNGVDMTTKAYFYGGGEEARFVTPTAVDGADDLFVCQIPEGNFTHVIITRSNGTNDWVSQTEDIPINRSLNRIWVKDTKENGKCDYWYDNYNP